MRHLCRTATGTSARSAAKVKSIVETAFDSHAALNMGDAGTHGMEKPAEVPGTFSGCAYAIATPSAKMSTKPNAKVAHLRTMQRSYTRPHACTSGRRVVVHVY
jgi:hypothetical protein